MDSDSLQTALYGPLDPANRCCNPASSGGNWPPVITGTTSTGPPPDLGVIAEALVAEGFVERFKDATGSMWETTKQSVRDSIVTSIVKHELQTLKRPLINFSNSIYSAFFEVPCTAYYALRNSLIHLIKDTTLWAETANMATAGFNIMNNVGFAAARIHNRMCTELAIIIRKVLVSLGPYTDPTGVSVYVLIMISALVWYNRERIQKTVRQHILSNCSDQPYGQRGIIREKFRNLILNKPRRSGNVLHPSQRSNRSAALNSATQLAMLTGLTCFHVQPRPSQVSNGDPYSMTHYWASDTQVPSSLGIPEPTQIITRFDSDYYEDMNCEFSDFFQPHFIYHHSPITVASPKTAEYPAHTFVDDTLVVDDNGAVHYEHQLWDYGIEEIRILSLNPQWPTREYPFPIRPTFNIFQVDTRRVSKTHCLTVVIPRIQYTGIYSLIATACYGENRVNRVMVQNDGFNVMRVISDEGEIISVGKPGQYNCANIKTEDLEMLQQLHAQAKMPITLPKIKTKTKSTDQQASVLQEFIISTTRRETNQYHKNYEVEYGSNTYQMYPNDSEIDPTPSCVSFMYPISNGSFSPARGLNTETASIEGRLTKLQQDVRIHPAHYRYIEAFVNRLIPSEISRTYHPAEVDYVFEKQSRPSQQVILENAVQESEGKPYTSTFVKKEGYGKISDPRIISTERPLDKLTWSQYQYSVADFLKTQPWYMFGKTPKQIAARMVDIATSSQMINCTDFSRMDGRKTIITRTLNLIFMLRLFSSEHHTDIQRLISRKLDNRASTATYDDETFSFRTLMAQLSGLPDTSNFNSLDNGFNNFIAYANMQSKTPTEEQFDIAFSLLMEKTAVAGDDTAAGDLADKAVTTSSKWIGHKITSDIYQRGDPGVNFLARIYGPDLWTGDPNSCTDIMRTISGFHTTPRMDPNITPMDKLGQKLTSYWYTDENTPILSWLTYAYVSAGGKIASREDHYLKTYWSKYDKTDQYPNHEAEYMYDLLPDHANWTPFKEMLNAVTDGHADITELLRLPLLFDIDVKPHTQQVVLDKDGDQMLVGEDSTRIDRPDKQEITIPIIPKINSKLPSMILFNYNHQESASTTVNGKIRYHKKDRLRLVGPRDKTKKIKRGNKTYHPAKRKTVWGGITALDIVFAHAGCGWEYSPPTKTTDGKEIPDFKVALALPLG